MALEATGVGGDRHGGWSVFRGGRCWRVYRQRTWHPGWQRRPRGSQPFQTLSSESCTSTLGQGPPSGSASRRGPAQAQTCASESPPAVWTPVNTPRRSIQDQGSMEGRMRAWEGPGMKKVRRVARASGCLIRDSHGIVNRIRQPEPWSYPRFPWHSQPDKTTGILVLSAIPMA